MTARRKRAAAPPPATPHGTHALARMIVARPVGDGWVCREDDVDGFVAPPEHARRDADGDLVWVWSASPDDACPACRRRTCVQQVTLRGAAVLVAHDVRGQLS